METCALLGNTPMPPKVDMKKKKIYSEDRVFAAQNKNGEWYLSFTTLDPEEKFKTRFIAKLAEKPPKEFIEEKEVKNDRSRFYLDKENQEVVDYIEQEYKFYVVNEESPYKPKKFGEKRKYDSGSDSDGDSPPPAQKRQHQQESTSSELLELVKSCYLLLQEISTNIRKSSPEPAPEDLDG